jgi:hypothetical protein
MNSIFVTKDISPANTKPDILQLKISLRSNIMNQGGFNMKQTRLRFFVFVFVLLSCNTPPTPTITKTEVHPALADIPVYPDSPAWREGIPGVKQREGFQIYSYIANVFKYETLMEFYAAEMPNNGWELLYKSSASKTQNAELMFTRSKTVAHIQMGPWTANSYLVYVIFYDDPILEK